MIPENSARERIKPRDVLCLFFFLFFWLLPVFYKGATGKNVPRMPPALSFVQNISRLFYWRINSWPIPYIQIRLHEDGEWETVPEGEFFQMQPFGYRTRLSQLVNLSTTKVGKSFPAELAQWIQKQYPQLHPGREPVAVRLVVAGYIPQKQKFKGHWKNPPLDSFPSKQITVVHEEKMR